MKTNRGLAGAGPLLAMCTLEVEVEQSRLLTDRRDSGTLRHVRFSVNALKRRCEGSRSN